MESQRTKETLLNDMEDIKKLFQYLYADENNYIEVENAIGSQIKIGMDEHLKLYTEFDGVRHSREIHLEELLGAIEQLKERFSTTYANTTVWQEICFDVAALRVLN